MLNRQKGNMYPWVTHTWNPVKGRCPHECSYCYMKKFWGKLGDPYLDEKCFKDNLGEGNTIFVGSSIDMFADGIPEKWLRKVFDYILDNYNFNVSHSKPVNEYLFQTKNTERLYQYGFSMPAWVIVGTTIETNRDVLVRKISKAPTPFDRYCWFVEIEARKMVSIEPIMDFDLDIMVDWIRAIKPDFVSIGADSKGNNLPEPPAWKIKKFVEELKRFTEVKIKTNLGRLM